MRYAPAMPGPVCAMMVFACTSGATGDTKPADMDFHAFPPEPLESRIAPAGIVIVNFEAGVLRITGDLAANEIDIEATDTGVTIRDRSSGDTQFSFDGALVEQVDLAGPIREVGIDMGGGSSNTVSLFGIE